MTALRWLLWLGASTLLGCASTPPPPTTALSPDDAVQLLEQTSFGPTADEVLWVQRHGATAYLDAQLQRRDSRMPELPVVDADAASHCPEGDAGKVCRRDHFSPFWPQVQFFQNALTQPDQLRQRMAWALGQIFVVSHRKNGSAYAAARYQQMLLDQAFGNFRSLLTAVVLHPVMGQYLDMANSSATLPGQPGQPNQNLARELLQLFTLGPVQLHPNGQAQQDAQGRPLPSYTADDINALARVLTGWTYAPRPGATPQTHNPGHYAQPLLLSQPSRHDSDAKTLLGLHLPAGLDPRTELELALDRVFQHPNVGPYISRRLIQQLVTGDPSPAYVERVARVFNRSPQGERGDLAAVLRAIVQDTEARGPASQRAPKLREPVLYMTRVLRGLGARSDGVDLIWQCSQMGQNLFGPATVFGYFPTEHRLTDSGLNAPEAAALDSHTSLRRIDFAGRLILANPIPADPTVPEAIGTRLDLSAWEAWADDPNQLLDRLASQLQLPPLTAAQRQLLHQAVATHPAQARAQRVRTAAFLLATSPGMQVQR